MIGDATKARAFDMILADFKRELHFRKVRDSGGQHVGHTNNLFTSAPPSMLLRFERLLRDAGADLSLD